jgi:TetR/AcrR family transcriptional regulator, transcriptional repressor for nem operon
MRYPQEHKEEVRNKIIVTAARAFRTDGIHGVSIPAIMSELSLTHGGFYAHFKDRDELVAAAIDRAADDTGHGIIRAAADLPAAVRAYASQAHVAYPAGGCVVAAMGVEAGRVGGVVGKATARAARGLIDCFAEKGSGVVDDDTLALVSQMVGAVVLARIVGHAELRERLLAAVQIPN